MRRPLLAFVALSAIGLAGQLWWMYAQTSSGSITTIAGTGDPLYCCDAAVASEANLAPQGVAVDPAGTLYVADAANHRIRKIDFSTANAIISSPYNGINPPADVKVDSSGNG